MGNFRRRRIGFEEDEKKGATRSAHCLARMGKTATNLFA